MRLFAFTVRRLRWLARIPIVPQFFDSLLLAWTAVWDRERLNAIELLEERALEIPGLDVCVHRFGGIGFIYRDVEIAHLHGNGLLDVCLGRGVADRAIQEGIAEPHHVFGRSAWISFWIRNRENVPTASYLINRALEIGDARLHR